MILESPPFNEDLVVAKDQRLQARIPALILNFEWQKWFGSLVGGFLKTPTREARVTLEAQAASLGVTALPLASIPAGIYRVSYYARITTPATVSSSLIVTISHTDRTIALTQSASAITGNTITTTQFGTLVLRVDRNSPVSYSTTYASVGATPMAYALDLAIEQLSLDD